jgi:hypothetical protein
VVHWANSGLCSIASQKEENKSRGDDNETHKIKIGSINTIIPLMMQNPIIKTVNNINYIGKQRFNLYLLMCKLSPEAKKQQQQQ